MPQTLLGNATHILFEGGCLTSGSMAHTPPNQEAATIIQAHFRRYRAQKHFRQQQAAAGTIQAHVSHFLARQQAADQQCRQERFRAVMARHKDRIEHLEQQKRLIQGSTLDQVQQWEGSRQAAATTIQAWWRGALQRWQLRAEGSCLSTLAGMRPIACCSPSLPEDASSLLLHFRSTRTSRQQQRPSTTPAADAWHLSVSSPTSAAATTGQPQDAIATGTGGGCSPPGQATLAGHQGGSGLGAVSSSAALWGMVQPRPPPEESSFLSGEDSRLSAAGAAAGGSGQEGGAAGAGCCRRNGLIPAAHRMQLERQIQMHTDAFKADPSRLRDIRAKQQDTDQRLAQLLQQHQESAGHALQAARRRQRLLHKAEVLYQSIHQLPQHLDGLQDASPAHTSSSNLPRPGSTRAQRARQAHAMALAEVQSSKWWASLRVLNTLQSACVLHGGGTAASVGSAAADHLMQAGPGIVGMQREWEQQEALWRSNWAHITRQEQQRI